MYNLRKIFDTIFLILDYPFVFYYAIQKKYEKYGLSHAGRAFALLLYFMVFATVILEHTNIKFERAAVVFLTYIFFRFFLNNGAKRLAKEYATYNRHVILIMKVYSVAIILLPIYWLIKRGIGITI